jgi:hypothetical protein
MDGGHFELVLNFTKQQFQYDLLTSINERHFTPEPFRDTSYKFRVCGSVHLQIFK